MPFWSLPAELATAVAALAALLDPRSAWRLGPLLAGHFAARGRRTVTAWLRGAGLGTGPGQGWQPWYVFLGTLADAARSLAGALLALVLERVAPGRPRGGWVVRCALDDTPTRRYGPRVQGAGVHRDPAPGPAGGKHLYGHVWVTLALLAVHPRWGTIALPLRALLYIRKATLATLPADRRLRFRTKHELAVELLEELAAWGRVLGFRAELVADGAYAARSVLRAAERLGIKVVSRLRRDAALRSLPVHTGGRGRPRKYGAERLSLAKRAGQRRGWTRVPCVLYGRQTIKRCKVFQATWEPAGGAILVVLTKEDDGSWRAFFTTDLAKSAAEVLGAVAERGAIEQGFHRLKEVLGAGQQQLRDLRRNIGAFHFNLWACTLVEWWAWNRPDRALVDRRASPWDRADRRPSHADKRKALRAETLAENIRQLPSAARASRKVRRLVQHLAAIAP
jgi:hypothetical protein